MAQPWLFSRGNFREGILQGELRRRVLLREPPDQAVDAFLLEDAVELGAVGEHQAHALDADVVDFPARAGLAQLVGDQNRATARAHELVAHGRLAAARLALRLAARRQLPRPRSRIRAD